MRNVSLKNKICFIHIPKTGGSSIERMFFNRTTNSEHEPIDKYNKYFDFFIFSVVRNPYTRIISIYNYYKKGGNGSVQDKAMVKDNCSLDYFIKSYNRTNLPHLRTQYSFLKDSDKINYVARFENLTDEIIKVCKMANIPTKQLPHDRKTEYDDYMISPEFVNHVNRIYKIDFVKYGYRTVQISKGMKLSRFIEQIEHDSMPPV